MINSPKHWQSNGALALLLYPLSLIYALGAAVRHKTATPWQAGVPVICVGNIIAGGAGKTPMAINIAKQLKKIGKNPHIVTRGYGGSATGPDKVDEKKNNFSESGDEAILLAHIAPTWVAKERKAGVMAAVYNGADVVILDDGLQNPSVKKDFSIVVVDGGYGFGNKMLLPAGPLRETIKCGISRADAVVVVGEDKFDARADILAVNPTLKIIDAVLEPINADEIKNLDVIAFAGIGRPEKFFDTLQSIGCNIKARHSFPDHHLYVENDILPILQQAKNTNCNVVTTAKDAVKIPLHLLEKISVLKVEIKLINKNSGLLTEMLSGVFKNV